MLDQILTDRKLSESQDKTNDINQEFVSEDYDTSTVSVDDIRREIEQLTEPKKSTNKGNSNKTGSPGKIRVNILIDEIFIEEDLDESEWDKALADELDNVSAEELEAQINQMLAGETK